MDVRTRTIIAATIGAGILAGFQLLTASTASSSAPRGLDCQGAGIYTSHYDGARRNVTGAATPLAAVRAMVPSDAQLSLYDGRTPTSRIVEWYGPNGQVLATFTVEPFPRGGWGVTSDAQCPDVQLPQRELTPEERADYDAAQERLRRATDGAR